jgi:NADP-reducing hydrogenase subunit HndD
MFGEILKSYYANKIGIDPKKMFVVSIMPCTAKKFERTRPELRNDGMDNVDCVLTTRELARMIKRANIDFNSLQDSQFDDPMGEASGAGAIFGTTGGVMEAALRTAYEWITGTELKQIDFEDVRGNKGIKKATIKIGDKEVKVVVAHSLGNARKVLDEIKEGKVDYQFVEIMACPGGCVMGGGQPIVNSKTRTNVDVRALRAKSLYNIDENSKVRKSHENPAIKKIYAEYLEKPGSHKAHELLHTTYAKREKYI